MKKRDYLFMGCVLLVCLGLFLLNNLTSKKGDTVVIYKNSKIYKTVSLSEDTEIDIDGNNTVLIKNKEAFMVSATCPDKLCMHQGKIKDSSRDIVCLPNKVTVKIKSKNSEVDTVSQ